MKNPGLVPPLSSARKEARAEEREDLTRRVEDFLGEIETLISGDQAKR